MALDKGTRLGRYEILEPIGAGGMGEVYRARDTRLDRTIAIKVLGQHLGDRPEILERFEREARAVSTLNHPNICTLHDVGNEGGTPYLVMEYLEGETLDRRLARAPLPIADACRIAIQIGEALDQAHIRSIVHRDLKPANVMLLGAMDSTSVKLLDFGLAKLPAFQFPSAAGGQSSLPTVALSFAGSVIGTLQYMSPEQLEGKETDARADIFGLGCVLYEMVTGRKAFDGQTQASVITAIMSAEPPAISASQPLSPPALDHLVKKCLAKSADQRWQSVRDVVSELRWISETGSQSGMLPVRQAPANDAFKVRNWWKWIGAGVLAVAAMAAAVSLALSLREKPSAPVVRFQVPPPEGQSLTADSLPVLSPDGTRIVFNTARDQPLVVRSLESLETRALPGTSAGHLPFWSADGRYVGFFAIGGLRKVDLSGGPPVMVTNVAGAAGGSWNLDNVIIYAPTQNSPLMRVNATGGKAEAVTRLGPDETGHAWPSFLPDGRHFVFTVYSSKPEVGGVFLGSLDSPGVTRLLSDQTNVQCVDPGYLLYARGGVLTAHPFDMRQLRFAGEPIAVVERISAVARPAGAAFSAVKGALSYHISPAASRNRMAWVERNGAPAGELGSPGDYAAPAISPDGQWVAVTVRDSATRGRAVWVLEIKRGAGTRLTFDSFDSFSPAWSPDGRRVAFLSTRAGVTTVFLKPASGTGQEERVADVPGAVALSDWTADGKYLMLTVEPASKRHEIWLLPLAGDRKASPLLTGPFAVAYARLSRDGKWIVYMSNESGAGGYESYVQKFPPAGDKWRISVATGEYPQWRADGHELFFVESRTYKLMAVRIGTNRGRLEAGAPTAVLQGPIGDLSLASTYAPAPDGQRFLMVNAEHEQSTRPFTVVLNWQAALKR